MKHYIFDVDNTLVEPCSPMDSHFMRWFENWILKKNVYICTNNTYENILPRMGRRVVEGCKAVFTSGGNSIWIQGREAKINEWRPSPDLMLFLENVLKESEFKIRSGPNIEYRTGMISFSIAGKAASIDERKKYINWDKQNKERHLIIENIQKKFPEYEVYKSGDTSIDITGKGLNKSQILKFFNKTDELIFYGNDFSKYGNDKPIAEAVEKEKNSRYNVIQVTSWNDTFKKLQQIR